MYSYSKAEADQRIEAAIDKAIERAVGFYYEKTKDDINLVLEATDFIKVRLEDMVTRDEFNELKADVQTIKIALRHTNEDLNDWKGYHL